MYELAGRIKDHASDSVTLLRQLKMEVVATAPPEYSTSVVYFTAIPPLHSSEFTYPRAGGIQYLWCGCE